MAKKVPVNKKEEEVQEISKEQEYLAGWQKALADYQNLERDVQQQKKEMRKYATQNLIMELIPVIENFKSAASHVPEDQKESAWTQGLMYIQQQLQDIMEKEGVTTIKTVGEAFDPQYHEAISEEESDKEAGTILKEIQGGYLLHEKVLMPAKVIISKDKNN